VSAPIFRDFMKGALADAATQRPFPRRVRHRRSLHRLKSGDPVPPGTPGAITESFNSRHRAGEANAPTFATVTPAIRKKRAVSVGGQPCDRGAAACASTRRAWGHRRRHRRTLLRVMEHRPGKSASRSDAPAARPNLPRLTMAGASSFGSGAPAPSCGDPSANLRDAEPGQIILCAALAASSAR